jgi:hypothetical protein
MDRADTIRQAAKSEKSNQILSSSVERVADIYDVRVLPASRNGIDPIDGKTRRDLNQLSQLAGPTGTAG